MSKTDGGSKEASRMQVPNNNQTGKRIIGKHTN